MSFRVQNTVPEMVIPPFSRDASRKFSGKNTRWKRENIPVIRTIMEVFLRYIRHIFPIFSEKIPRENIKILRAMSPILMQSEMNNLEWLSQSNSSGKMFQVVKLLKTSKSLMKSTGMTESAPARMPSPNL